MLAQWRILYIIFGSVYVIGGIVYLLFGSAIPRKWAKMQAVNTTARQDEALSEEETVPMNEKI